ncbi:uncharacterized protein LOC125472732 [Pyrus x bretschneideri]|uniref:uncharacterized protein LOC125472732 n=1 Tax=Pyrus x bretschneideri TaxID=225117 RepID=UPI00202DEC4E|nr:uncharacterized protein LOC125472732 [Pyrus x bretschneideri]
MTLRVSDSACQTPTVDTPLPKSPLLSSLVSDLTRSSQTPLPKSPLLSRLRPLLTRLPETHSESVTVDITSGPQVATITIAGSSPDSPSILPIVSSDHHDTVHTNLAVENTTIILQIPSWNLEVVKGKFKACQSKEEVDSLKFAEKDLINQVFMHYARSVGHMGKDSSFLVLKILK